MNAMKLECADRRPLGRGRRESALPVRAGVSVPVTCNRPTPPSRARLKTQVSSPRLWACLCCASLLSAQEPTIEPVRPSAPVIIRPYRTPTVPPIRLNDTSRLGALMRGGILYLTVQDAIALVLENDIDLEVARYGTPLAEWNLERSQAGGALPGVPSGASLAGSVANGQGVAGSQAAAGVAGGGFNGNGAASNNATISQVGPVAQTLDPLIQENSTFSHISSPQANPTQTLSLSLISNTRSYSGSYQQGFLTGGSVTVSYTDHYLSESAESDFLNPSSAPNLSIAFQHNLLQGFGVAVNARTINVNRINVNISDLNFRTQTINVVANAVNLYYNLAAAQEDLRAKRGAVSAAEEFYGESKRREELGAMSHLDVTSAESQLASTQSDLIVSETNVRQQEVQLKNMFSRKGVLDPALAEARIVLLDRMEVPLTDDLPPVEEMMRQALANRPDLASDQANIASAQVSAIGTINGVLPVVQVIGGTSNAGLSGTNHGGADAFVVGGIGNGLAQVFRRDYPTERIGVFGQVKIHNRQAQADEGIDQLTLRQTQLTTQKTLSQVQVDISNYAVAVRQARVRYQAAVQNLRLQQQLYDAEQRRLVFGASTPYNVIQQQRDLIAAQATQISALAAYSTARVALDQTLGVTLEVNHVSLGDAITGKVARPSSLPAVVPAR